MTIHVDNLVEVSDLKLVATDGVTVHRTGSIENLW